MDDFKVIQRIFAIREADILEAAEKYPKSFLDGVAVVTYNRVYADNKKLQDYENYCEFCEKIKKNGLSIQVNFSSSIGHGDIQKGDKRPFENMVDSDGNTCNDGGCIRGEGFKSYLSKEIERYARLKPDVFWIDDDFRLAHHPPVKHGCFCKSCIQQFNKRERFVFDRETLKEAIVSDKIVDGKSVRRCWQEYNRDGMQELVALIVETIRGISDEIIIGFMQCRPEVLVYDGLNYDKIIEKAKNKNGEVWFRHGSGFYDDKSPYWIVTKNISIGRFCAMTESSPYHVLNLTEEVTSPYIRRGKSMKITLLEAIMNIGVAGAAGIMDEAIKPNLTEQLLPDAIVAKMHENYDYLNMIYKLVKGKKQIGVYPYFSSDLWQYHDPVKSISEMDDLGSAYWKNLFCLGIPFTFRKENANVLLLSGKTVKAMSLEELQEWLTKGIYADGTSALEINKKTSESVTGIKKSSYDENNLTGAGTSEVFTSHSLNGSVVGYERYNIWGGSDEGAACLEADGSEVLSYSMCEQEAAAGIIGMSVFENSMGGRISVSARGAWCDDILGKAKTEQITNVFEWLFGGKMPVRLECNCRIGQSIWDSTDGKERILFLYNLDYDDAENIKIKTDGRYIGELLLEDGGWIPLSSGSEFVINKVAAWTAAIVRMRRIDNAESR